MKKEMLDKQIQHQKVAQDLSFLKKGNSKNLYKLTPQPLSDSLAGWQFPNVHLEKPRG